jgi:acyl-homoserine-lactone acylase
MLFAGVRPYSNNISCPCGANAGGESGDVHSPHVDDEAVRFATGNLRVVYFHKSQLQGHVEREYHPGK